MGTPLTPRTAVYGLKAAGDPQLSPDGATIVYSLGAIDFETKKTASHLYACSPDGSDTRQLTYAGQQNRGARWSPDGRQLAFVSDRVEKSGIFLLALDGGESRELCRYAPGSIQDLAWSPDGTRIAFIAPFDEDNPESARPKEGAAPPVRVTRRIDYKQDTRGYLDDLRWHLFVLDVASGEYERISTRSDDHTNPAWSPDGTQLAVRIYLQNTMRSALALLPAGGGETMLVTPESGAVSTWAWSPDGSRIAYTGDPEVTWQPDWFVYDLASGETRRVTGDLPCLPDGGFTPVVPPSQPAWIDDHRLLFHAVHRGASGLWEVDIDSGDVQQVEGELELRAGMSTDRAGRYVAQAGGGLDWSGEIVVIDRQGGGRKRITTYNDAVFAESKLEWERFDVRRGDYVTEAWLLKPQGFDPSRRYPLVLDVHGGPNGFYGYGFNAIQQVLAGAGFVVVFANPRGSTSYGRDFTLQVMDDWGGEDYLDLMAVVDRACEEPYVDRGRLGIWGYSYGGYMTAWTISQSQRFRAAVCGAPCFDLESMYGTSDIAHFFGKVQWGGPPHEAREAYARRSPSNYAHNTRTPTLIVHGEADDRCPIGQGEQMYVALKEANCEVEFARYPGGSHLFLRVGPPEHREDVLERVTAWFKAHL